MNYIAEIRAFNDWVESNPVSASCISLWYGLMFQANKTGWKTEFSVAISTLELRTGLKRGAIYKARNTLRQHGIINFKERAGNQSAIYQINSLCSLNEHKSDTSVNTNVTQSETQKRHKREPLLYINETKQNETNNDITTLSTDVDLPYAAKTPQPQAEPKAKPKPDVDIPALYAELCPNLPQIKGLSDKRKAAIKALLRQASIDDIKEAFAIINQSDFCLGVNDKGWKASFDFCIKPQSIINALEGKYDTRLIPVPASQSLPQGRKETVNEYNNRFFEEFLAKCDDMDVDISENGDTMKIDCILESGDIID